MNKAQLIDKIAAGADLSTADAGRALDSMLESIRDALKEGDKVSVVGFGSFQVHERTARSGRDPRTGIKIQIPAVNVPSFKAGKLLKDAVN